jgi:hypothetical protein
MRSIGESTQLLHECIVPRSVDEADISVLVLRCERISAIGFAAFLALSLYIASLKPSQRPRLAQGWDNGQTASAKANKSRKGGGRTDLRPPSPALALRRLRVVIDLALREHRERLVGFLFLVERGL